MANVWTDSTTLIYFGTCQWIVFVFHLFFFQNLQEVVFFGFLFLLFFCFVFLFCFFWSAISEHSFNVLKSSFLQEQKPTLTAISGTCLFCFMSCQRHEIHPPHRNIGTLPQNGIKELRNSCSGAIDEVSSVYNGKTKQDFVDSGRLCHGNDNHQIGIGSTDSPWPLYTLMKAAPTMNGRIASIKINRFSCNVRNWQVSYTGACVRPVILGRFCEMFIWYW